MYNTALTVDESMMLLYAGCYEDVPDPDTFYAACTSLSPTKSLLEKDGRSLMDSLLNKGLVYVREGVFDWTDAGRKTAKKLFHIFWFGYCIDESARYYPKLIEFDGNVNRLMAYLSEQMLNRTSDGFPASRVLDRLQMKHDEAMAKFDEFIACDHAPGYDDSDLYHDSSEPVEGPLEAGYFEEPKSEVVVPVGSSSPGSEPKKKMGPLPIVIMIIAVLAIGIIVGAVVGGNTSTSPSLISAQMTDFNPDSEYGLLYPEATFNVECTAPCTLKVHYRNSDTIIGQFDYKPGTSIYVVTLHHPTMGTVIKASDVTNISL